jgi:amino acid permease
VSVASVHHDLVRPKTLTIFKGIFLTCGKILHDGGPGGAILAYVLTGTIVWSVIASLGEMTALMPVKSPITEFTTRYVDSAIGFATGWMYWSVCYTIVGNPWCLTDLETGSLMFASLLRRSPPPLR